MCNDSERTPALDWRHLRFIISPGAIVSLQQAAMLLVFEKRDARAWLLQQGIVRDVAGRSLVVWADVMDAVRNSPEKQRRVARLRREPL